MTPTPVLPSLPEPFVHCYEWKDLRNGTRRSFSAAPYNGTHYSNSLALFTAEQMNEHARRAIESLSRAPAEPAETEAWLIRMSDGTRFIHSHNAIADYRSLDPAAKVVELVPRGSGAHPTESAGHASAEVEADARRYRWLRAQSFPWGKAWFSLVTLDAEIDSAIKLGESHGL